MFSHLEAPKRVHRGLRSDVLIVVIARDPVERSWSHYLHARRYGWTRKPLEQAIKRFQTLSKQAAIANMFLAGNRLLAKTKWLSFIRKH